MKDYDKNKESSYLKHCDVNNLDRCPSGLEKHLSKDFIKDYSEDSDEGYFLEVDVQYIPKLHDLHNNFPFAHEKIKIEKVQKMKPTGKI